MVKMEESKSIDVRFIEALDIKSGKEDIEDTLKGGSEDGVEILLDEMLSFLAEMPVDNYHDYRTFRHRGLRIYLINRFLREKWYKNELSF